MRPFALTEPTARLPRGRTRPSHIATASDVCCAVAVVRPVAVRQPNAWLQFGGRKTCCLRCSFCRSTRPRCIGAAPRRAALWHRRSHKAPHCGSHKGCRAPGQPNAAHSICTPPFWIPRTYCAPPPPPLCSASDGLGQGASTTRFCFSGYPSQGRCDPDGAALPLP